jgi:tetratricopeptide (TPR) repeat protein
MDLGSLIAAALLSLGLIGTDAVLNAGTVSFDIQVTDDLAKRGYTPQLVDAMMDIDLKALVDFKSMVHPPQIRSSQQKSIVGAVADSLNLKEVTSSFQADFGLNPVRLTGSLMQFGKDGQQLRFILAGESRHTGEFIVDQTSGDRPLPQFLDDMALEVVSKIEPYAAAVYQFKIMSDSLITDKPGFGHQQFKTYIDQLVTSEAGQEDSDLDHAALHNLIGLSALMIHDTGQAEAAFKTAVTLDPAMGIPLLNLALTYVSEHRYDEAIALADAGITLPRVKSLPYVLANIYTVKALALWGKGDLKGASEQFQAAVWSYRGSFWAYFYWSELLNSVGNKKDGQMLRLRAQHNLNTYETYPEVALLHVRVITGDGFALKPIDLTRVRHVEEIYAEN